MICALGCEKHCDYDSTQFKLGLGGYNPTGLLLKCVIIFVDVLGSTAIISM